MMGEEQSAESNKVESFTASVEPVKVIGPIPSDVANKKEPTVSDEAEKIEVPVKPKKVRKPKPPAKYNLGKLLRSATPEDFDAALKLRSFRPAECDLVRVKLAKIATCYRILYNDYTNLKQYFLMIRGFEKSAQTFLNEVAILQEYNTTRTEYLLPVLEVDKHFDIRSVDDWAIGRLKSGMEKLANSFFHVTEFEALNRGPINRHLLWLVEQVNNIVVEHSDDGQLTTSTTDKPNGNNDIEFLNAVLAVADPHFKVRKKGTGKMQDHRAVKDAVDVAVELSEKQKADVENARKELKEANKPDSEIQAFANFLEQEYAKQNRRKF
jgi:hypothetical protein